MDGLCSCFAKSCDACFSGLSYLLCPINRPSPAPALLSGLVNIGGGVASLVYVLLALGEPCPNPRIWSLVWVGLAAANTIFTCYGYYKLCMAHKGVPLPSSLWDGASRPFLNASPTLPQEGGRGGLLPCLLQNGGYLLLMEPPPRPGGWGGGGQEWVGGFQGRGCIPDVFPLCVGR